MNKIVFKRIRNSHSSDFEYAKSILTKSFPCEEYRDLAEWGDYTENKNDFYNNVILCDNKKIGILSLWNFSSFIYIEHFAISPEIRSKGFGHLVMNHLLKEANNEIILEVELPNNDQAKRRIHFYEEIGFHLCPFTYHQPPYRKGDELFPMRIMSSTPILSSDNFCKIKGILYSRVYAFGER